MIVYSANKGLFVQDVRTNVIATKILDLIREKGLSAGQDREFTAWHNSMKFMRDIIDDPAIDDEVQVAIEYNIPQTSKRVDFIIIGADGKGKDNIIIVELKQWSKAEVVDDDMHFCVRTYVANDNFHVPGHNAYKKATAVSPQDQCLEHLFNRLSQLCCHMVRCQVVLIDLIRNEAERNPGGLQQPHGIGLLDVILHLDRSGYPSFQQPCHISLFISIFEEI